MKLLKTLDDLLVRIVQPVLVLIGMILDDVSVVAIVSLLICAEN